MAEIITIPLSMPRTADLLDPPQPRDESKVHVSTLVNEAARLVAPKWYYERGDVGEVEENGIMALGRMWEYCVRPMVEDKARAMGCMFDEQIIQEHEGVIGTLDGRIRPHSLQEPYPGHTLAVVEIKSRHSNPMDPREHWRWMVQVQAYCYMAECKNAWMPVLYVKNRPPDAELLLHQLVFEEWELVENWGMLMNVKKGMETANGG